MTVQRFDDVVRFNDGTTGSRAAMDARLLLDMVPATAAALVPGAQKILDLGCGAGNYTIKMLEKFHDADCTLLDVNLHMLEEALRRVIKRTDGCVDIIQVDMREVNLAKTQYDVVVAAMSLHCLREFHDWRTMFQHIHDWLRPGGVMLVADLVSHDHPGVDQLQMERWNQHLTCIHDEDYRRDILMQSIEFSPRSLSFQLDIVDEVGFSRKEVLHKNACFAAYYAVK